MIIKDKRRLKDHVPELCPTKHCFSCKHNNNSKVSFDTLVADSTMRVSLEGKSAHTAGRRTEGYHVMFVTSTLFIDMTKNSSTNTDGGETDGQDDNEPHVLRSQGEKHKWIGDKRGLPQSHP